MRGESAALPHDLHGRHGAALELEREREHVVDLAAGGAVVARERHVGAGRRDAHRRPGDRLHEVDAVARALEHLTAAGRLVGEPRAPGGRAEHAHGEQAERALGEQLAHVGHPVDRAPLVADRAHHAGALDRLDDRARVVEIARDGLLEVDGQAALERGDGDLAVQARRRQHEHGIRPAALEQRLPVGERLARRSQRSPRPAAPGRDRRRTRPARRARSGSPDASPRSSRSRSGRSSCHHLAIPEHGARAPAHLGSVPHARVEPFGERRRRERPGRLGIPHDQVGRRARLRRRARRTAGASRARSAGARRAAPRSASAACAPPLPGRPRRARRTRTAGREPRCP